MILSDELVELLRSPLAGEHLILLRHRS
jgi:hypothetical protein